MTKSQKAAVEYLRKSAKAALAAQIAFAEIPSPSWQARKRSEWLIDALAAEGLSPSRDRVGNVIAHRPGTGRRQRPTLIVCAHMDSVFYNVTDIKVRRSGRRHYAPGIGDDASGIANLVMLARALRLSNLRTAGDLVIVGSVGEEGEGLLRGMRHFFKNVPYRDPWFVAIDGGAGRIVRKALASWSPRITVKGPGGHSHANFGRPNPLHMLARVVSKLTCLPGDPETDTVYNATVLSGGAAVNVIPESAALTLNLRSSDPEKLAELKAAARRFVREAKREELDWATDKKWLEVRYTSLERPGGETPADHPLVATAFAALKAEGHKPAFAVLSTDANMPISLGIPAITIGAGGTGGNAHSLDEWFDNTGRSKDLAALGRIVLEISS